MSPDRILNDDLYHDRTVQDWHRLAFGKDCIAIDIDLAGACKRCAQTLYLVEATTNPDKSTRILRTLGERAGIPTILVRHRDHEIVRATWQNGNPRPIGGEENLKDALDWLREDHRREGCS